ncbi:hypothetical protein I4U23_011646 [Adineta vaga]|nr:hypothetical protein I4U23_011646 [Adineta vaga]
MINIFVVFLLTFIPLTLEVSVLDPYNYDAYGTRIASNDYFVVLAQNDLSRYSIIMAPFGTPFTCNYGYGSVDDFVMNVAVGRRQNSTQMSFVYLRTNSSTGTYQKLGVFTFSQMRNTEEPAAMCDKILGSNNGEYEVKVWNNTLSEMSTLQMNRAGTYAYGFLSNGIFIFDVENKSVQDISWEDILPSIYFEPHALDVSETSDGIPIALVAGYYQYDANKALPILYLIRLNPPSTMMVIKSYTLMTDDRVKFTRSNFAFTYQFNYAMSVSIHDSTQQVLVGVSQSSATYLFSFNSTNLQLIKTFNQPARSISWIDNEGIQAALLLANVPTLPWTQSRVLMINTSSTDIISAYPNNQQTFEQWTDLPPTFNRLATTFDNKLMVQASDGTVLLIHSADAGYFIKTNDIYSASFFPEICPAGTYKSITGPTPCQVCPTNTKSSPTNITNSSMPTIMCAACLNDSFCPLGSVNDVNLSTIISSSQAYAYPTSPSSTSFDDILIENVFSIQTTPVRCILLSPFFWALITLFLGFIILIIMGIFYYSPTKKKHLKRLQYIFRQTDLIGNGELWFGGLVSFAIVVLVIFSFWFGSVFIKLYPIETSNDADFACDASLRNAQFSSGLQLLSTIKSDKEKPIFDLLEAQNFTLQINFVQTGFLCQDIRLQNNFGSYAVDFLPTTCLLQSDNATLTVSIDMPYHLMDIQLNLTGEYYIGGVFICLTGANSTTNDSVYTVQELKFCQLFSTSEQTLGQTTKISFILTKVINRTDVLDYSGSGYYSGRWIPTTTYELLNDALAYKQQGNYLRYLATQQILKISFSETQFYVINEQQPIVRTNEMLFHGILFTTTIIGLFALAFVIIRLSLLPLMKWMMERKVHRLQFWRKKTKEAIVNKTML